MWLCSAHVVSQIRSASEFGATDKLPPRNLWDRPVQRTLLLSAVSFLVDPLGLQPDSIADWLIEIFLQPTCKIRGVAPVLSSSCLNLIPSF